MRYFRSDYDNDKFFDDVDKFMGQSPEEQAEERKARKKQRDDDYGQEFDRGENEIQRELHEENYIKGDHDE